MKKKLLITLGCSFTEGVGCYDYSLIDKPTREYTEEDISFVHKHSVQKFLEESWGSQLQDMLGYDDFLNLGVGNASNSHSAKLLFDSYLLESDLNDSEVLVIWLMTYSHRKSFYTDGFDKVYSHGNIIHDEIAKVQNRDDTTKEDLFYLKSVYNFCKNKGWKFLFSHVEGQTFDLIQEELKRITNDNIFINEKFMTCALPSEKSSKICPHPNKLGYKDIVIQMMDWIEKNNPQLISDKKPNKVFKRRIKNLYNTDE